MPSFSGFMYRKRLGVFRDARDRSSVPPPAATIISELRSQVGRVETADKYFSPTA
ncbi:hypothetical protein ACXIZN_05715 [Amycolatopsis sp. TRM77291]